MKPCHKCGYCFDHAALGKYGCPNCLGDGPDYIPANPGRAYYNENDKGAAAWLRELIAAGLIAPGDVDTQPIQEVSPEDVKGYTQCHFFAGIGGWSYALRLAGWTDGRPVWTGSCPCQPFSAAGKQRGTADDRHLWPEFARLIGECRPAICFGEQVASKLGREWLAGVFVDLESLGYAVAGADLCAPSVGAPHIRQRLWWMADARFSTGQRNARGFSPEKTGISGARIINGDLYLGSSNVGCSQSGRLDNPELARLERHSGNGANRNESGRDGAEPTGSTAATSAVDGMADAQGRGLGIDGSAPGNAGHADECRPHDWTDSYWHPCRDGKARRVPTEPALFPLADGLPGRVGILRGAGNAIVPQVAAAFIQAADAARQEGGAHART